MSTTFAARLNRLFDTVYPPGRGQHTSAEVIAALKEINPDYLMPAHCVGEPFYDMVRREMPGKVFQSNVGTRYSFIA